MLNSHALKSCKHGKGEGAITCVAIDENKIDDEDSDDNGGEFRKITMSEGEPPETSDEEDTEFLQLALENTYACLPLKSTREPAKLSSLR